MGVIGTYSSGTGYLAVHSTLTCLSALIARDSSGVILFLGSLGRSNQSSYTVQHWFLPSRMQGRPCLLTGGDHDSSAAGGGLDHLGLYVLAVSLKDAVMHVEN